MSERKKDLMQRTAFFASFKESELYGLIKVGNIRKYPMYEILIREDDVDTTFFVILRGNVNIIKEDVVKRKHNLASLEEGECFGEVAMLKGGRRSAFVVTGLGCYLFRIDGNKINKLELNTQVKLYQQIAKSLAVKLTNLNVNALSQNREIPLGDKSLDLSSIMTKLFPKGKKKG